MNKANCHPVPSKATPMTGADVAEAKQKKSN